MFEKLRSQNTPIFEIITFRMQINSTIEKKINNMMCTAVWEILTQNANLDV